MILAEAIPTPYILLGASFLLVLSILGSKVSERFGIPILLIFLAIGMLAGSEGIGGVYFDDAYVSQFLGTVALAYIIFSGGLSTEWQVIRPVLWTSFILSTAGVLLTAVLVAAFATLLMGFSWREGMLLGSIMSSTDAAAVFAVLRSRNVSLRGRVQPLLEFESGSNDPMAVFLTVTSITLLQDPGASWLGAVAGFVFQMGVGAAMGLALGKGIAYLINRARLEYEGLYPVLTLALVLLVYGATQSLGGNGFLAVYLAGIVFGNSDFLYKNSLKRFHDGLAWLMQIAMFLTLGLLVFPSHVAAITGWGLAVAGFLMVVARPLSVLACTIGSGLTLRERFLASWVGLRGAVPIVLATFPLLAGLAKADLIFNLVFFVVLSSVLLQGKSIPLAARWLRLDKPLRARTRSPLEYEHIEGATAEMVHVEIPADSQVCGQTLREMQLPQGALVVLVNREGAFFVPHRNTQVQANDVLLVMAERSVLPTVREALLTCQAPSAKSREP